MCYTQLVKNMVQHNPLNVEFFGMDLKVFRFGKVQNIGSDGFPTGWDQIHSHFTYEIFFVTSQSLTLVTEDGARSYERKILIIPPRIRHYTLQHNGEHIALLFSMEKPKKMTNAQQQIEHRLQNGICQLPLSDEAAFYAHMLVEKSGKVDAISEKEQQLLISLLFHSVMAMLLAGSWEIEPAEKRAPKHIYEIESFINKNISGKITLKDVADHIFLSTKQVSRVIQKEYDCTLSELVTDKKLATAEMLIKHTDMRIEQIAQQVNLGSTNYFFTVFKKRYGLSPLQYRKNSIEKKARLNGGTCKAVTVPALCSAGTVFLYLTTMRQNR